jgi:hypothetical protein
MGYNGIGWNLLFAGITYFFGGLGMFFTRYMKSAWSQVWWNYIPIFWIPILMSWIPAICILLGWYDSP